MINQPDQKVTFRANYPIWIWGTGSSLYVSEETDQFNVNLGSDNPDTCGIFDEPYPVNTPQLGTRLPGETQSPVNGDSSLPAFSQNWRGFILNGDTTEMFDSGTQYWSVCTDSATRFWGNGIVIHNGVGPQNTGIIDIFTVAP